MHSILPTLKHCFLDYMERCDTDTVNTLRKYDLYTIEPREGWNNATAAKPLLISIDRRLMRSAFCNTGHYCTVLRLVLTKASEHEGWKVTY